MLKPVVKWAGGKRLIYKHIYDVLPEEFNNYHEPFVGGGAVLFNLHNDDLLTKEVYINDKNEELINLYLTIRDNLEELREKFLNVKVDLETFLKIRNMDRDPNYKKIDNITKAFRFLYLNKTCFNGLCRYSSNGYFNTPYGKYENVNFLDITYIYGIRDFLKKVTITNTDFIETLKNVKEKDLVYLDPPYYPLVKTSFINYNSDKFLEEQQRKVREYFDEVLKRKAFPILSNSNTDFIKDLYKDRKCIEIIANRFINSNPEKRNGCKELIIV